jgi:hypothetical protein
VTRPNPERPFRVCAGCGDYVWPGEQVYHVDGGGIRCAVCQVKSPSERRYWWHHAVPVYALRCGPTVSGAMEPPLACAGCGKSPSTWQRGREVISGDGRT